MPNPNKCHVMFVLDRSGSMNAIRDDVVGATNTFIDTLKKGVGECSITIVQFDSIDPYEVIRDAVPINECQGISPDDFLPRGNTPLYDAVGDGIYQTGAMLAGMPEQDRPGKVVFVIQTDGMENCSMKYTAAAIKKMIEVQTRDYSWEFIFLGANQDAILTARNLGIDTKKAANWAPNKVGTQSSSAAVGENINKYRGVRGQSTDMDFSEEQRVAMMNQEKK